MNKNLKQILQYNDINRGQMVTSAYLIYQMLKDKGFEEDEYFISTGLTINFYVNKAVLILHLGGLVSFYYAGKERLIKGIEDLERCIKYIQEEKK